ncbi:MAG TPA: HAD family hydrolase [Myxococcota bacterium]|nr:HAD family hydrolase [Myxococcota bacterium]
MRPFVFLDRDGTLIEDRGYVHALADYAPLPGAYEAVRALGDAGFGLAIVTNQSGIARGLYTARDFARFQAHLLADFSAHGAKLDAVYHCPHLPDAGCDCRKPRPGLVRRAQQEFAIDLARSWVIGDQDSDVGLARAVGCAWVRIAAAPGSSDSAAAPSLLEAVRRYVLPAR